MEEIRLFPVIWNKFMTEFKNKHKKVNAFKEVGEKFGLSAENDFFVMKSFAEQAIIKYSCIIVPSIATNVY